MSKAWRVRFLDYEAALSQVLAVAFVVVDRTCLASKIDAVLLQNRSSVYGTLAGIFGSLLGFVITAASILLTFASAPSLKLLRDSPHYATLWRTYKSGIRAMALATVAAVAALVLDRDTSPSRIALYAVVACSLFAAVRLGRCLWILEKVIDIVTGKNGDRGPPSGTAGGSP
jgi:hypothetical protein